MKNPTTRNTPQTSINVFGYCRVSTTGQEDNTSLQNQQESIQAYCKSQGWNLLSVHIDVASGKDFDRPQFKEMESDLKRVAGIVVYKLDRFSRSLLDGYPKILEYEKQDVFLKSVTEGFIDTTNAMSRSMLRSMFNFVQTEREIIVERMLKGKSCNADKGHFNGGNSIHGYQYTPGGPHDFEIIEEQAQVVRELFTLYSTGRYSLRQLKEKTGCPLSHVQIGTLLSNVFYTGRIKYDGQIRWNNHEKIVADKLFNFVQKIRSSKARSDLVKFYKVVENKAEVRELC